MEGLHSKWHTLILVTNNQYRSYVWKILRILSRKSKEIRKNVKILKGMIKYWELVLAFYYISRCQYTTPEERRLNIIQRPPNRSLQLQKHEKFYENIRMIPVILSEIFDFHILLYFKVPRTHYPGWNTSKLVIKLWFSIWN